MEYAEIQPIPSLVDAVHCLWTLRAPADGSASSPDRVLPDGRSEIIINRAAPFCEIRDDGSIIRQPSVLVATQMTRFLLIRPTAEIDLVGIRFTATGLRDLLRVDLGKLCDQRIALTDIDAHTSRTLRDAAMADDASLIGTQRALATLLDDVPRRSRADLRAAVQWILADPTTSRIDTLASRLSLSHRQLERRFLADIGLSPKRFARIVRFDALVRSAQSGACRDWTTLAHAHGYHDQSHFNRDFRAIAGQTPTQYARSENLIASLFTTGADVSHFYNSASNLIG